LDISQQIAKFRALEQWLIKPQGHIVSVAIANELEKLKSFMKSAQLLQLGVCGSAKWFDSFNSVQRWVLSPDQYNKNIDIASPIEYWPLENNSVDMVFAPFTLESVDDINPLIHEIDRVLKPMGRVIIMGINTWSLWSLAARTKQLSCFGDYSAIIHSPLALNRKFTLLGYRQFIHEGFWYIPPIKNPYWLKPLNFLNETGKILWPLPAGLYCFVAQKYDFSGPRPLVDEAYERKLSKAYQNGFQPTLNRDQIDSQ
jgi:SAM-dependent methyltransferase